MTCSRTLQVHAKPRALSPRTPANGVEGEEASEVAEAEPTFMADFSFDFFIRGSPPPDAKGKVVGGDPREKLLSEEIKSSPKSK